MLSFLSGIVDFFKSIISLVWQIITGLIRLLALIPEMVTNLTDSLGLLPSFLVAFATVTITVSVIFIILGRSGGGESS